MYGPFSFPLLTLELPYTIQPLLLPLLDPRNTLALLADTPTPQVEVINFDKNPELVKFKESFRESVASEI